MAWPPDPNCLVDVWDRPPTDPARVLLASDVPVRQLKPWAPYTGEQQSESQFGFLFRWVIFSYVARIQHAGPLLSDVFYATIVGDPDPGFYQGLHSQNYFDPVSGAVDYTYMVLTHVHVPGGP